MNYFTEICIMYIIFASVKQFFMSFRDLARNSTKKIKKKLLNNFYITF